MRTCICKAPCICNQRFIGQILKGYCGGAFGRDGYGNKTIEVVGKDYIVVRYDYEGIYADKPDLVSFEDSKDLEDNVIKWLKEER